jgi:hypothetical protein
MITLVNFGEAVVEIEDLPASALTVDRRRGRDAWDPGPCYIGSGIVWVASAFCRIR